MRSVDPIRARLAVARAAARKRRAAIGSAEPLPADVTPSEQGAGTEPIDPDIPLVDQAPAVDDSAGTRSGSPFDRHSPVYFGFAAGLGALAALTLWRMAGRLTTTLTILLVAVFLTLALDPIVESLTRRGLRRSGALAVVIVGVLAIAGILAGMVVPPVVEQGSQLLAQAPTYVNEILTSSWAQRLDQHYDVVTKIQTEVEKRVTDGSLVSQIFGGVLGAGRAVANGVFQAFTILVLTLYFLSSLPRIKHAAYAAVPASRRDRVSFLSEEIMRRVGSYAIGQITVATINALCSFVMMRIIDLPYAAVLAVVVGFLGIIPMVGATLGAVIVAIVAFFSEPKLALVVGIYYLIYQQVENYVIAPRIMQRTVAVPGAVTIIAALVGGTLLGVVGALIAIPIAAGLLLIYEEVLLPRQARS